MTKVLFLILFMGSVVCGATNFPSHIGMGSKASTVGKISSYSKAGGGLWTGYWKPNALTVSVREEAVTLEGIQAWPNPTSGVFNINYDGNVTVFSHIGSVVFKGNVNEVVDISNATSGVYIVRTEEGRTIKIIKQ